MQDGRADAAASFPPVKQTSEPPNSSHLWIQVRTTMPLDTIVADDNGTTLTHKCAIASDLSEVDVMMKDIGFEGYAPNAMALLTNAYIEYVPVSSERQFLRDVVVEILDPNGAPDQPLNDLEQHQTLYTDEVLNLYYVHYDDDYLATTEGDLISYFTGIHIRDDEGYSDRMIFVSDAAHADTLAHEFGHALSGGHVNFWDFDGDEWCAKYLADPDSLDPDDDMDDMKCEFSRRNYMWAGSEMDRQQFGEPQIKRLMYNEKSLITEFSEPDAKLECPDFSNDPDEGCVRLKGYVPP